MKPSKRIQQYRKPLLIGMVLFSCIVGGCLFPIVNCNPENPVETSLVMKTIILLSVFIFYTELGMLKPPVSQQLHRLCGSPESGNDSRRTDFPLSAGIGEVSTPITSAANVALICCPDHFAPDDLHFPKTKIHIAISKNFLPSEAGLFFVKRQSCYFFHNLFFLPNAYW